MTIKIQTYKNAVSASCKWKNRRCEVTYDMDNKKFYMGVKAYINSDGHFGAVENIRNVKYVGMRLSAETFTILTQCQLALIEHLANHKK